MSALARKRNRKRGGRPRKLDTERQPDGRVKPKPVKPSEDMLDRRTDLMAEVIRQFPHNAARRYVEHPDAAWHIGRLHLAGALSVQQRDAAEKYRRAARLYETLLMAPKAPTAVPLETVHGTPGTEETAEEQRRFARAKAAYERYHGAVMDCGHDVAQAVARALRDEDVSIDLLRTGLNALVKLDQGR